jgi:beta-trans-bergamotene synthase
VEEDRIAKPHRPLPSGRISPDDALRLYYILFALMWAAALYEKTILCTLVYSVAIVIYNEGGLAAIPVLKNVIGAVGLSCYCWGTTIILGKANAYLVHLPENDFSLTYSKIMEGSFIV